jgi:neutral trehalase
MWIDVSSSNETKLKGITSLSNLIQNTTKTKKTTSSISLEAGKQFKEPVNLKAFKTISNIGVM